MILKDKKFQNCKQKRGKKDEREKKERRKKEEKEKKREEREKKERRKKEEREKKREEREKKERRKRRKKKEKKERRKKEEREERKKKERRKKEEREKKARRKNEERRKKEEREERKKKERRKKEKETEEINMMKRYRPWPQGLGLTDCRGSTFPWSRGQVDCGIQIKLNAATGPYWPKGACKKKNLVLFFWPVWPGRCIVLSLIVSVPRRTCALDQGGVELRLAVPQFNFTVRTILATRQLQEKNSLAVPQFFFAASAYWPVWPGQSTVLSRKRERSCTGPFNWGGAHCAGENVKRTDRTIPTEVS